MSLSTIRFADWLGSEDISTWLYFIPLSTLLVALVYHFKNYANREKQYKLIAGANIGQSMGNSLTKLGLGFLLAGAAGLIVGSLRTAVGLYGLFNLPPARVTKGR